jgi:hypothetical protein
MKTITLILSGDEQVINLGLDSFCRGTGWTEQNGFTQEQWSRDKIRDYISNTASAYNAMRAAETARLAAISRTGELLGTLSLTLTTDQVKE